MGEVYRARDTRLERDVALKVLPQAFVADAERLARFKREAHLLASLNHPNIAAIYGLEDAGSTPAIVMELVEGPTLAERIAGQPLAVDDALAIARQIVLALDAAHERGIVHRDLKPANIKLRDDGTVKVLDFGLAKVIDGDAPSIDSSMSPTLSIAGTRVGVILGTAAYMAPEQARGRIVDKRADVWAFGCVLFEMLAGRRAFDGSDVSEVLAGVIKSDPDWTQLPVETPATIRRLLGRCLQKDPKRRLRDIGDAQAEIDGPLSAPPASAAPSTSPSRTRERIAWAAALLTIAVAAVVLTATLRPPPSLPELRLQIDAAAPLNISQALSFALSPDGRTVAYLGRNSQSQPQIWLRRLDVDAATPLPGTEHAGGMQWAPDSRSLVFVADQKLRRVDAAGGNLQVLADAAIGFGIAWGARGDILFTRGNTSPISRVSASGGAVEQVTRLETDHATHRFPSFLPDGRRFLYYVVGPSRVRGIHLGVLGGESRRLFDAETAGVFLPPDRLLHGRGNTLVAQRVDLDAARPIGDPVAVAERIAINPTVFASIALSVSGPGAIAYRTAPASLSRLVWFDRTGKQMNAVEGPPTAMPARMFDVSADGRRAAIVRVADGNEDIWIVDLERGTQRRMTFDPLADAGPIWSPDGTRIAFYAGRRSGGSALNDLYLMTADQAAAERPLLETNENKNLGDWSPDGRYLVYASQAPTTARDIWAIPVDGNRTPILVVRTPAEEASPKFSPDGRWIVYQSNETGRTEIFVRPFMREGASVQVSTSGGTIPQWTSGGREIVYRGSEGQIVALPVTTDERTDSVRTGVPVPLFPLSPNASAVPTRDGRRFLVRLPLDETPASPITILLNWSGVSR
jgi:serine/threonine protein kinase/Tol biopolymer transport system component